MAKTKIETVSEELRAITFIDSNQCELSFGLIKNENDIMIGELYKIANNYLLETKTLSKTWLKEYTKECVAVLSETGNVNFRTPLGKDFFLTKKNLIELNDFLKEEK